MFIKLDRFSKILMGYVVVISYSDFLTWQMLKLSSACLLLLYFAVIKLCGGIFQFTARTFCWIINFNNVDNHGKSFC